MPGWADSVRGSCRVRLDNGVGGELPTELGDYPLRRNAARALGKSGRPASRARTAPLFKLLRLPCAAACLEMLRDPCTSFSLGQAAAPSRRWRYQQVPDDHFNPSPRGGAGSFGPSSQVKAQQKT